MKHTNHVRQIAPVAIATAGAALFLLSSPAAVAATQDWNSWTDPLIAWEDGAKQALAYGTAYTKEGSLKNHTHYKDPRPGGDGVYTETEYSLYEPDSVSYENTWGTTFGKDQSTRNDQDTWVGQYDAQYYANHETADRGRVFYKVCEDQPRSPDACSANPFITFTL